MSETSCNNYSPDYIVILFTFILILFLIGGSCGYYHNRNTRTTDNFSNVKNKFSNFSNNNYNPLYNDRYIYTQPPGDVYAQKFGNTDQGTSGEFLPIQGKQVGTFMKNSSLNNQMQPSQNKGIIGGYLNYTTQDESPSWIGFNNFPGNVPETNSYLYQGANERVCNPGQKCDKLSSPEWWPTIKKDNNGFSVQGSDLMVNCKDGNINTCPEGKEFQKFKNESEWRKVVK